MSALDTTMQSNPTIFLKSRPEGDPTTDNFQLKEEKVPVPQSGEFLYRTLFLSLDPYLRGRMSDGKSYIPPFQIGEPIVSGFVGEIVESNHPKFAKGDRVAGMGPWSTFALSRGEGVAKVRPEIPSSTTLGVLGMPGMTAYVGLLDIGKLKPGETVVVSAASGAVGALVGQLAKLRGCPTVGLAGSPEKCAYAVEELGFDACINYRTENVREALKRTCPDGIDVYFDNVGGTILEAAMANLRDHARIVLCGMISEYNMVKPPPGPNLRPLLVHKASIQGFIVSEHWNRLPAFIDEVAPQVLSGRIKYREDIVKGLENAPQAFLGLLAGKNFGKLVVQV